MEKVAVSRFPHAGGGIIDEVVGFAISTRYPLDSIHNVADDAHRLAEEAGREQPRFEDVEKAIRECAGPTYRALTTKRDIETLNRSKGKRPDKSRAITPSLPEAGSATAEPQQQHRLRRGGMEEFRQGETPTNRVGYLAPV